MEEVGEGSTEREPAHETMSWSARTQIEISFVNGTAGGEKKKKR